MRRYLLMALLPAGLTAIAAATAVMARRASACPSPAASDIQHLTAVKLPDNADNLSEDSAQPTEAIAPVQSRPCESAAGDWVPALIRLGAISGVGGVLAYEVMAKLAPSIIDHGLAIDEPIFHWTQRHQLGWWAAAMSRFNKIGNTWTAWGAVGSAAACLGFGWRRQRWLPPSALGVAILVDYGATHRLHRRFQRPGPPTSPLGTYPSGGTDRVVLFYGLIAYLIWREFSGSPRGRIWAIGGVSALSFIQAYCRQYLNEHWFIDIVCGLLYGALLLVPIVVAAQLITDQADPSAGPVEPSQGSLIGDTLIGVNRRFPF
jgi:membrane-associated phospholipid phosphatase